MAIFDLCTSDDEGVKEQFCTGTIYYDLHQKFGKGGYEYSLTTLQAIGHFCGMIFGVTVVVMSGIAFCTDCSSNRVFMICTVIIAALTLFFITCAAAVRANWFHYFTVTNPNVAELDEDPLRPDVAARLSRDRANIAMFSIAVISLVATVIFLIIATILAPSGNKK